MRRNSRYLYGLSLLTGKDIRNVEREVPKNRIIETIIKTSNMYIKRA